MDDFWENLQKASDESRVAYAIDGQISGKALGDSFESVRNLTDRARQANALSVPVQPGTRVSFVGSLGAYLSMDNPPPEGSEGTVVTVRSANGDVTHHEGKVFAKWDDGEFRAVHAEFLRKAEDLPRGKKATAPSDPTDCLGRIPITQTRIRVASLGDLSSFLKVAENTLIHKSTNDLWEFKKDADGGLLVERLFDDNGQPLRG